MKIASCGGVGSELSVDHVGHQRSVQHGKRALDISVQIAFIQGVSGKLLLKRKNGLSVVELGQKFCLHVVGEYSLDSVYNLLLAVRRHAVPVQIVPFKPRVRTRSVCHLCAFIRRGICGGRGEKQRRDYRNRQRRRQYCRP